MGKATRAVKGRTAAGLRSGRVVDSTGRGQSSAKSKAGKKYASTKLGKMC